MAIRGYRHRQDDPCHARLKGSFEQGTLGGDLLAAKLLARIRRTYDEEPGEDSYGTFFERLTSVDLLHIDDFGAEKRSDWVLEQLYALVNERYEDERSIMLTTNLTVDKLEDQIGRRTVSRLTETCEQVPLFGADRRLEKAPY